MFHSANIAARAFHKKENIALSLYNQLKSNQL